MSASKRNMGMIACLLVLLLGSTLAQAAPGVKLAIREALELASKRSGRELAEASAREAGERILERNAAKLGDKALTAAADGGLELIEAAARHGDEVMKLAVEASPAARRVFALKADALLPLARRVGPEALELEAKAPGAAARILEVFGDDAGKAIARSVPAEDLPRLLTYAEKADSAATRKLLLETYQKEGKSLFERIPAKLVLAGGVTAAMLYATHNVTSPMKETLSKSPALVGQVLNHAVTVGGLVFALLAFLVLWRFGLLPWHRKAAVPKETQAQAEQQPKM